MVFAFSYRGSEVCYKLLGSVLWLLCGHFWIKYLVHSYLQFQRNLSQWATDSHWGVCFVVSSESNSRYSMLVLINFHAVKKSQTWEASSTLKLETTVKAYIAAGVHLFLLHRPLILHWGKDFCHFCTVKFALREVCVDTQCFPFPFLTWGKREKNYKAAAEAFLNSPTLPQLEQLSVCV